MIESRIQITQVGRRWRRYPGYCSSLASSEAERVVKKGCSLKCNHLLSLFLLKISEYYTVNLHFAETIDQGPECVYSRVTVINGVRRFDKCCHLGGRSYEKERGNVRERVRALYLSTPSTNMSGTFFPLSFLHCPLSLLRQQTAIEIFWHATLCFHYSQKIWQQSGRERERMVQELKKELNEGWIEVARG